MNIQTKFDLNKNVIYNGKKVKITSIHVNNNGIMYTVCDKKDLCVWVKEEILETPPKKTHKTS